MAKIVISALHPHAIKAFTQNTTSKKAETILGGSYPYTFYVINTSDSLYMNATRADERYYAVGTYSTNISDNSYDTVDYSRSIYNTFVYRRNLI